MSNDALTPHEWKAARRRIVEELGDDILADKIEDTISYGFQSDELMNHQLDEWAAQEVMKWGRSANNFMWWLDLQSGQSVALDGNWRPSENLAQALQVAMETDIDVDVCLNTHHELGRDVKSAFVTVDAIFVHEGAFDEEAIARKIMVELWRRLERGET